MTPSAPRFLSGDRIAVVDVPMPYRSPADGRHASDRLALFGIAAIALTRILFRSRLLYDLDSINFALGMLRFDPAAHQPHPPGYFLYVSLARFLNRFLPDANTALVAMSIAASCATAWMIYLLTREWFGRDAARLSMLLFLFSPLCWFHGIVALTYIVEAFFSAAIGYLCWRIYQGRTELAIPVSIAFGVAAGFRPSTALLLAPLWLFSIWRIGGRRWLAMAVTGATILLWFVPMAEAAGGIREYLGAFQQLWSTVPGRRTTLSSPWLVIARILTIGWVMVLCLGFGAGFLFRRGKSELTGHRRRSRFVWLWITPGLCFFVFVFFNYVNSGHLLVLCPPLFAISAARLHGFLASPGHRSLRLTVVAAGIAVNCAFFGFAGVYCSFGSVRHLERDLKSITKDFGSVRPDKTLIVGFDSHFLGYRHAGYYLPDFVTVQYPEVTYGATKRVFLMHGRSTQVVQCLPVARFERFIFYPLPYGEEYTTYFDGVRAKLPEGTIGPQSLGDRIVMTGPASALPLLFPSTACK